MKLPIKKSKPRIGKPYSQQAGRKAGKGAGKIVAKEDGLNKVKVADIEKIDEMVDWLEDDLTGIKDRINDAFETWSWHDKGARMDDEDKAERDEALEEADSISYEVEAHIKALEKYARGVMDLDRKFRGNLNTYVEDVASDTQDILDSLYSVASISDEDQFRGAIDNLEDAISKVPYLKKSAAKLLSILHRKKLPIKKSRKPSKPRVGKPYKQQLGRKPGKGAGKIVQQETKPGKHLNIVNELVDIAAHQDEFTTSDLQGAVEAQANKYLQGFGIKPLTDEGVRAMNQLSNELLEVVYSEAKGKEQRDDFVSALIRAQESTETAPNVGGRGTMTEIPPLNTVGDVFKALDKLPPNTPIYASSDEEGNSYHKILDVAFTEMEDGSTKLVIYPGIDLEMEGSYPKEDMAAHIETVGELKKALQQTSGDTEILASSDEEGNSYHKLLDIADTEMSDGSEKLVIYPGSYYQ